MKLVAQKPFFVFLNFDQVTEQFLFGLQSIMRFSSAP